MDSLEALPKYIYDEGGRCWLTLTTTVQGKWNIGYGDVEGHYLAKYAIGDCATAQEAVTKLTDLVATNRKVTTDTANPPNIPPNKSSAIGDKT